MALPKAELKDRLKEALSLRNMKPIELSEKTGIPKSAISQYMSGYAKPKSDRIFLLAKALHVTEAWLIGYDVDMEKEMVNIELANMDIALTNMDKKVKEYALKLSALPKDKQEHIMSSIDMLNN